MNKTKCSICKTDLEIGQSHMSGKRLAAVVYCQFCDRKPDNLVQLLDKLKGKAPTIYVGDVETDINEATGELYDMDVTITFKCLRCEKPTNQYGFCLWCTDELEETS